MRSCAIALLFVFSLSPSQGASAVPAAAQRTPLRIIAVDDADDIAGIRREVLALLDDGQRLVLAGRPGLLLRVRPDDVMGWPATNTVVIDPSAGLGIAGFDAPDDATRSEILAAWRWADATIFGTAPRSRRDEPGLERQRHVEFSVPATSPSHVCRVFSHEVASKLFGDTTPTLAERRAFRREMRRWCQYGTLSQHVAEASQFTIEPFFGPYDVRLTITTEWALIRNEDPADASAVSFTFWTKTLNEGAGSGFSRVVGTEAWYDPDTRVVHNLMDAAIHAGWGPIQGREVVTAWPLHPGFPLVSNVLLFRCEDALPWRPSDCPVAATVRRLFPDDSMDGKVTVASGEAVNVGGDAKISTGFGESKISLSFTFGVNLMRSTTKSSQVELSLVHTRSNADTLNYRSTWWLPDVAALFRWIDARKHGGSLASATPLAATLNPRHELLWDVPLAGNEGRALPYHMIYEVGWNHCRFDGYCADYRQGRDRSVVPKERGAWSDGMTVHIPWQ
ncbi:MAG TPA: hypothetical protein VGN46_01480 [Luteibacter sp.]|jgi:hypothetical protein|uniref:hypothetical protein n=1 Tax=Luteibacter sp. TaxID=1886636 RepID=UPI002F42566D